MSAVELLADDEDVKVPEHLKGAFAVLRRGLRESPELRAGLGFTVIVSLGVTVASLVTPVPSRSFRRLGIAIRPTPLVVPPPWLPICQM